MKSVPVFLIICAFIVAGCAQPAARPVSPAPPSMVSPAVTSVPEKPVIATAQRYESEKILITYYGGPDADHLIELQTTVVTKAGSVHIQSMGSRMDTTPVRIGGTDIFQGPYPDMVHVSGTAYYANGTHLDVLDTEV